MGDASFSGMSPVLLDETFGKCAPMNCLSLLYLTNNERNVYWVIQIDIWAEYRDNAQAKACLSGTGVVISSISAPTWYMQI